MEVIAENTGEAWDKLYGELLQGVDSTVSGLDVLELRYARVYDKYNYFR